MLYYDQRIPCSYARMSGQILSALQTIAMTKEVEKSLCRLRHSAETKAAEMYTFHSTCKKAYIVKQIIRLRSMACAEQ